MTIRDRSPDDAASTNHSHAGPVDHALVGEVWPAAHPGTDPVLYGHAALETTGPVEVRSAQTFVLRYTAGRYGLDDTGAMRVAFRALGDAEHLQVKDPSAPNYLTATSSSGVALDVRYGGRGTGSRPWWRTVTPSRRRDGHRGTA